MKPKKARKKLSEFVALHEKGEYTNEELEKYLLEAVEEMEANPRPSVTIVHFKK